MCTVTSPGDDTYAGWTNRETWAIALYINNDEMLQETAHGALTVALTVDPDLTDRQAGEMMRDLIVRVLDDLLDAELHELYVPLRDDFGSLWRVDTAELGRAFLADLT